MPLDAQRGIQFYLIGHEASAVFMADVIAQIAGGPVGASPRRGARCPEA